jgi:hypothetical protein
MAKGRKPKTPSTSASVKSDGDGDVQVTPLASDPKPRKALALVFVEYLFPIVAVLCLRQASSHWIDWGTSTCTRTYSVFVTLARNV